MISFAFQRFQLSSSKTEISPINASVAMATRSSPRESKRPPPFQWTSEGQCYILPKSPVVQILSKRTKKRIDAFYAALALEKSTIARGGKGVFAREPIRAGEFITKYDGAKIALVDAQKLQDQVGT
jgi:hypothetical protein